MCHGIVIVASGLDKATDSMPKSFKHNKKAMALAIENNIASTIINNQNQNPRYYSKMSELLSELIELKKEQNLVNMVPDYGELSEFQTEDGELKVNLAPADAYVFEIDTPYLE